MKLLNILGNGALVLGAVITAAAIGTASAASANSAPAAPLPLCGANTYDNSSGNCVHDPEPAPSAPPGEKQGGNLATVAQLAICQTGSGD